MNTTSKPIFIVGRHRSGTTWLSNIIGQFPGVYAPQHESAFFSHLVPYCNHGRTTADLLAIKALFEGSELFALTGLGTGPPIAGRSAAGYFREVMDAAAARRNAEHWLEKTPAHTLRLRFLLGAFPDAVVIAVIRDYRAVVASNVHGFGRPASPWSWLRQSAVTAVYEKIICANEVFTVRYESLQGDYENTVRAVMARIGISQQAVPANVFARNTSFTGNAPQISWWQSAAMRIGRWMVWIWSAPLVERIVIGLLRRKKGYLPGWFFAAVRA